MQQTYADRNRNLKRLGFNNYSDYLVSELWMRIRVEVFQYHGKKCRLCGETAGVIHHLGYGMETLRGEKLSALVPLCDPCHYKVEFNGEGIKKSLVEAHADYNRMWVKRKSQSPKTERSGICQVCGGKLSKKPRPCKSCIKTKGKPWIGLSHKRKQLRRQGEY